MNFEKYAVEENIPELEASLSRLTMILEGINEAPRVSVLGKYNHGKSSLLNSLMDQDFFSVADKRETREIKSFESNGIQWVDAPGLGADLEGSDDQKAHQAASEQADILMLVHAANTGELDNEECQLFRRILRQDFCPGAKAIVVLTRVDQLSNEDLLTTVNAIKQQLPEVTIFQTSATRYSKGKAEKKPVLVEKSGISALKNYLHELVVGVRNVRSHEGIRLIQKARIELVDRLEFASKEKESLALQRLRLEAKLLKDISKALPAR